MFNKLFPRGSVQWRIAKRVLGTAIPTHLEARFRTVEKGGLDRLEKALIADYLSPGEVATSAGEKNLLGLLVGRLEENRTSNIPWIDDSIPLDGARILGVGCGTGASTVAMAEQGAVVTGVDISEKAIDIARLRCEIYGVTANLIAMDATRLTTVFSKGSFDLIVFWACLEHMTHAERMIVMRDSWSILERGGLWGTVDTPNRLHHFDGHTSLLPFFHWLPDEVAMAYSNRSPRPIFQDSFLKLMDDISQRENFYRWGRGISYHEFELSIADLSQIDVVSNKSEFEQSRSYFSAFQKRRSPGWDYSQLMHQYHPDIPMAFLQESLELLIRKQ